SIAPRRSRTALSERAHGRRRRCVFIRLRSPRRDPRPQIHRNARALQVRAGAVHSRVMSRPEPEFRHLGEAFFHRAAELGGQTFLKLQSAGRFEEISWSDFAAMVRETMLGLDALGLRAGDRVAIIGENSLPWLCADLATLASGLANVVISSRLSELT